MWISVLVTVISSLVSGGLSLPPKVKKPDAPPYLELAKEMADKVWNIQQQREVDLSAGDQHGSKAERMMSAFNRMSPRTRALQQESEKTNLQLDALALLALEDDTPTNIVRELSELNLDVFRRQRATTDTNCDRVVTCDETAIYRTADGTCNNIANPLYGSSGIQHKRILPFAYDNNSSWRMRWQSVKSTGRNRVPLPECRRISDAIHKHQGEATGAETPSRTDVSQMTWAWGQFLAHDLVRTPEGNVRNVDCCNQTDTSRSAFCMPIEIASGDSYFTNGICMPAKRSATVFTCDNTFQNQINEITAYVDASNIYGSSEEEMQDLRSKTGGYLMYSTREFPPNDTSADAVCDRQETKWCAKSERRANVVPSLTSLHTVFLREHNRIAKRLGEINPAWTDEMIFQEVRKIVAAEMQFITYSEFLPTLLSADTMTQNGLTTPSTSYAYDPSFDASIQSAFSIAFRGHSMIPAKFKFFDTEYKPVGSVLSTTDTYLHPHYLFWKNYNAINEIARWVVGEKCPMADRFLESTARNELFKSGTLSFDLACLNIERGRDWGLPTYTSYRDTVCGRGEVVTWDNLTDHDQAIRDLLATVYVDPNDVDLYTGLVTEAVTDGSMVGPTAQCLIAKQFKALKEGDRFWHETTETSSDGVRLGFTEDQLNQIRNVRLSRVLCDNLDIPMIQENAFKLGEVLKTCGELSTMDLDAWSESRKK